MLSFHLQKLLLYGNQIQDAAALVAPGDGVLQSLEELHLAHNLLSDTGCSTLVAALSSGACPSLRRILLRKAPSTNSSNQVSDAAVAAVHAALSLAAARRKVAAETGQ